MGWNLDSVHDSERLLQTPLSLATNRVQRRYVGGMLLESLHGDASPRDSYYPEEWVGSTTATLFPGRPIEEGLSRVILPDGRETYLRALIEKFPELTLGRVHCEAFGPHLGLLCKLLDSASRLPIQTHPTRLFARQHLNSAFGKTEAWIILQTRRSQAEPPYILLGFREGVTAADFLAMARSQDVVALGAALNRVEVQPGEVYFVPAGMPHAIGPGVFMVEVQEPTDFVINVEYEYGGVRRTEEQCFLGLGFDVAMQCFNFDNVGTKSIEINKLSPQVVLDDTSVREEVLLGPSCAEFFGASRLAIHHTLQVYESGRPWIGMVVGGMGELIDHNGARALRPGSSFFVAAAARQYALRPSGNAPLQLIKCIPPTRFD
jgi:mannose-6-phosphate isomerase